MKESTAIALIACTIMICITIMAVVEMRLDKTCECEHTRDNQITNEQVEEGNLPVRFLEIYNQ